MINSSYKETVTVQCIENRGYSDIYTIDGKVKNYALQRIKINGRDMHKYISQINTITRYKKQKPYFNSLNCAVACYFVCYGKKYLKDNHFFYSPPRTETQQLLVCHRVVIAFPRVSYFTYPYLSVDRIALYTACVRPYPLLSQCIARSFIEMAVCKIHTPGVFADQRVEMYAIARPSSLFTLLRWKSMTRV